MAIKFDRYHRGYLFWIYPLIILGFLILAVIRDKHKSESVTSGNTYFNGDTSITNSIKELEAGRLNMTEYIDSTMIFYVTNK